jgi:hypothetical protein
MYTMMIEEEKTKFSSKLVQLYTLCYIKNKNLICMNLFIYTYILYTYNVYLTYLT